MNSRADHHPSFRKAEKFICFLAVCLLVSFLPVFVYFGCGHNWIDIHFPGEYQRVYGIDNFYECVRPPEDTFHPPHYQPLMVNIFLLIVYSSVVYGIGLNVLRRTRRRLKKPPLSSRDKPTENKPAA